MKGTSDIYYQAVLSRDPRFDGKFFIGVKTTGIYCRTICPARSKRENIEFFSSALAAERAGYRPCMRCRPECAPSSPAWIGKSATVQRALKMIGSEASIECDENQFAAHFGISARHLRRLFEEELGKTPKQIFNDNRLNFARKLVVETRLPITEIALTSGFSSIRRFNDAFKERFHKAPSDFRKTPKTDGVPGSITLSLSYRPPFDWTSLLGFHRTHEIPGVEKVSPESYQRAFFVNGTPGNFILEHSPADSALKLKVFTAEPRCLFQIARQVRQMFDLDSDPLLIENHFERSPMMASLVRKYPGLRLPRGWDTFETAVCAVLGQLVSTGHARQLVGQLVENYGDKVENPHAGGSFILFPSAQTLARSTLSELKTTRARKNTLRELSRRVLGGKIKGHPAQDPQAFRQQLLSIKGIGPWTAEYISMRAIGDTDAFPENDLVLKRALAKNPALDIQSLRPWRAYAALYLWKESVS